MGLENPLHILIVLVVVLLVFGARKLPEMGRGLGHELRGFKEGLTGAEVPTPPAVPAAAAVPASAPAAPAPTLAVVASAPAAPAPTPADAAPAPSPAESLAEPPQVL